MRRASLRPRRVPLKDGVGEHDLVARVDACVRVERDGPSRGVATEHTHDRSRLACVLEVVPRSARRVDARSDDVVVLLRLCVRALARRSRQRLGA